MSQTTTPSGAQLLATLDDLYDTAIQAGTYTGEGCWFNRPSDEAEYETQYQQARTAVAALIARNAELEAERDALIDQRDAMVPKLFDANDRADALAAENKALRNALDLYIKAGFGNSTDFYAQSDAYNTATRAMRGEQ